MSNFKPYYSNKNYRCYHTNGDGLQLYPKDVALAEVNVYLHDSGMFVNHNMPCPVCKTNHAMCNTSGMIMHPCDECSEKGWELSKYKKEKSFWEKYFGSSN